MLSINTSYWTKMDSVHMKASMTIFLDSSTRSSKKWQPAHTRCLPVQKLNDFWFKEWGKSTQTNSCSCSFPQLPPSAWSLKRSKPPVWYTFYISRARGEKAEQWTTIKDNWLLNLSSQENIQTKTVFLPHYHRCKEPHNWFNPSYSK